MRREWTTTEENRLKRMYLKQPVKETAKILNRSVSSVKHKAAKLGLNHYTDSLNAKTISKCFNCDISVILRWIHKYSLPCQKVECKTQTRYLVDITDFWKWAEKNKDIVNWSRYERLSLLPEPEWIDETIKNYNKPKSRNRYTDYEIITIKNLLHKGLNYHEIANEVGRSYYGISHLCRDRKQGKKINEF